MQRNEGALKALMEWLVAHMYKGQPPVEASDRALRAVSGQLSRNAPYVEASIEITDDPTVQLVAGAISPSGTVAVVRRHNGAEPLFRQLWLATYARDGGFKEKSLGTFDVDARVCVSFPEGSEKPAVVVDTTLHWGGWTKRLDQSEVADVNVNVHNLLLWKAEGARYAAFLNHTTLRHFMYRVNLQAYQTIANWGKGEECVWIGLVDRSLARISVERDPDGVRQTLQWRDVKVQMPMWNMFIKPQSIGFVDGGLQFAAERDGRTSVFWSDGHTTDFAWSSADGRRWFYDRGEIFMVAMDDPFTVERFAKNRFEPVVSGAGLLPFLDDESRMMRFGSTLVISNFALPAKVREKRVCIITSGHGSSVPNTTNDLAIARLHDGIALHRRGGTFLWQIPTAAHTMPPYAEFPLYGLPFDRLTEVTDERGQAVMSWAYTDGTLHVIRYPLPKPR